MSCAQLLTAICVTALALLVKDAQTCWVGVPALGWIVPGFDQALEVGESIDIVCVLNETQSLVPNATAQDLRFFVNKVPILDTWVSILSERAIGLHIVHSEIASSTIDNKCNVTCKIHDKELCTKHVTVGYKPLSISNFSCISYNWENLTCTWAEPENPVKTEYTLSYSPRASDPPCLSRVLSFSCPNATKSPGLCTWSASTNPPYPLTSSKSLLFKMNMKNALVNETITQCLTSVPHTSIVLPSKMENLIVSNITASSARLSWKVPEPLSQIPTLLNFTLNYSVSFKPLANWTNKTELLIDPAELNITGSGKTEKNVQINLPFAYVDYEIKVQAKSSTSEDLWSDPATVRFTTAADVPCSVTNLTAGSFRFIEKSLLVFWNPVTPDCQRGKSFEYKVTFESENENRTDVSQYDSFIELKSVSSSKEARVTIRSENEFYHSEPSSRLFIPSDNQRPSEPKEVLSVFHAPHLFEVLWSLEENSSTSGQPIDNFTIFWCDFTPMGNCNGTVNFTQLPAETYSHNITLPPSLGTDLMFFVSSERGSFSSGMQPACSIKHSNEVDQVIGFTVENNTNNRDLNVKWKPIYCNERKGIILGYRIQYSVASKQETKNFVVSNTENSYTITDTQPNSNYCVRAAVISRDGEGEWTEFACAVSGSTPPGLESWLGVAVAASAVAVIAVGLFFGYRHWKRVEEVKNQEAFVPWKLQPREQTQRNTFHSAGNSSHRSWLTDHSTLSRLPNSYETESLNRSTLSLNAVSSNSSVEDTQSLNSSSTSKETVEDAHSTILGLSKPYVQLGSTEVVRSPEDGTIDYSGKSESCLPNQVSSD